jgi:hypothetical protein
VGRQRRLRAAGLAGDAGRETQRGLTEEEIMQLDIYRRDWWPSRK